MIAANYRTGYKCAECGLPATIFSMEAVWNGFNEGKALCSACDKLLEAKRLRDNYSFLRPWINHAALNLSAAIAALWYALVPPQWTGHSRDDLEKLSDCTLGEALREGFGRERSE